MSDQTVLDPIRDLVDQAKRVLPGGSFGNMPAEVVLKEGSGGQQLVSYHGHGSTSSSNWFHQADWLDFNSIQSGHGWGAKLMTKLERVDTWLTDLNNGEIHKRKVS